MAKKRTLHKKERKHAPIEIDLRVYTNNKEEATDLVDNLKVFYKASMASQIGLARCLNKVTGVEQVLLVGINRGISKDTLFPLAAVVAEDELGDWEFPDGYGRYT